MPNGGLHFTRCGNGMSVMAAGGEWAHVFAPQVLHTNCTHACAARLHTVPPAQGGRAPVLVFRGSLLHLLVFRGPLLGDRVPPEELAEITLRRLMPLRRRRGLCWHLARVAVVTLLRLLLPPADVAEPEEWPPEQLEVGGGHAPFVRRVPVVPLERTREAPIPSGHVSLWR